MPMTATVSHNCTTTALTDRKITADNRVIMRVRSSRGATGSKAAIAVVMAALVFNSVACGKGATAQTRTFKVDVAPVRQLDMVFMIGTCCGNREKMLARFSNLIGALKDPTDFTYPDLRIALIDSDLGTGGAYPEGSLCGRNSKNGGSAYGDLGKFQMGDALRCGMTTADALWIENAGGKPVNYRGGPDAIAPVFNCLAESIGRSGDGTACGIEQSLQSFEYALVTGGIGNEEQRKMLRPYAELALVFITDQDDCSAATNDGMFGAKPELAGEAATLRCATRAHQCNGVNLTAAPPGYPTVAEFSAPFASCKARTDACPNVTDGAPNGTDTSVPTECSPLKSIKLTADELKALKQVPEQKLLVAGIFGWPRAEESATATYRIGLAPSADPSHPQIFDYWPVCYDPDNLPKDSGYDASAWGLAAQGGLRLAAFLDEFGTNGLRFSICERDYSDTMTAIGTALARRLTHGCVSADIAKYANCTAQARLPDGAGGYLPPSTTISSCDRAPDSAPCYKLTLDPTACADGEYLAEVSPASAVAPSTLLQIDCK
jgi:hypothetical protein